MSTVTIHVYQANDGRWGYAPKAVRTDPKFRAFTYEGEFDTGEQALAAAKADRSIPKGAKLIVEEPIYVERFVLTHIRDGMRTLATAAQGRCTYATREEAQTHLDAVLTNNSESTLNSVYNVPTLAVRPCKCWAGHFDPVGIYFEEDAS
jgi:hypothetical protein